MEAKSHCKVHYGDGGDEEEAELEEFYDYSSRSLFYYLTYFSFLSFFHNPSSAILSCMC